MVETAMGKGKDISSPGLEPRQRENTPAGGGAGTSGAGPPTDAQLELERLRAERDAMAAELQEERAERLRAEERLRLLEREKLEQMRQGAASREKLASELEEARLRAMRAEARQSAQEADTRLAEIESRRRRAAGARGGEEEPPAEEIAEPPDDHDAGEASDFDEPSRVEDEPPRRGRRASSFAGTPTTKDSSRPPREPSRERETSDTLEARFGRPRTGGPSAGSGAARPAPPPEPTERAPSRGDRTGSQPPPRSPERGPGARSAPPPRDSRSAAPPRGAPEAGAAASSGRTGAPHAPGTGAGGAPGTTPGGATSGRTGGASSRPRLDRTLLESRLEAGATFKTTDRFRQFQPVAHSHIKVCDWLGQADNLAELEELAKGLLPRSELIDVLVLFFERSFLAFDQS